MFAEIFENVIEILDSFDTGDLVDVQKFLYQKESEGIDKVGIILNTYGGDVSAAISLFDTIKSLQLQVDTLNAGFCESAGVIIFMAGENRYAYPHATFLLHEVKLEGCHNISLNDSIEALQKLSYSKNAFIEIVRDALYNNGLSSEKLVNMFTGANSDSRFNTEFAISTGFAKKFEKDCIFLPKRTRLECTMKNYVTDCNICPRICKDRKDGEK